MDLGLETQKADVGTRINIFEMLFVLISGKTDNFEFSHLNLGNCRYFRSNNVEGVATNTMETEMSLVDVGAWFSNTLKFINYISRCTLWQKQFCSRGNF